MEIALLCLLLCNSMKSHSYVLVFNEECKDAFLRVIESLAWIASFSKRGLLAYLQKFHIRRSVIGKQNYFLILHNSDSS
jgi:hypothetical protein